MYRKCLTLAQNSCYVLFWTTQWKYTHKFDYLNIHRQREIFNWGDAELLAQHAIPQQDHTSKARPGPRSLHDHVVTPAEENLSRDEPRARKHMLHWEGSIHSYLRLFPLSPTYEGGASLL